MKARSVPTLPLPVRRLLRKLGGDLRDARVRRRIPTPVMAERAMMSRGTLGKVERGDGTASMASYATVMFILGLADRLGEIADVSRDTVGLALEDGRLPKRVRAPKPRE